MPSIWCVSLSLGKGSLSLEQGWTRVCSTAGSPWQAGAWKQGLCTICSPCQDICKSRLGSYHGFFLKVKDSFEGVSFYMNKSHNELLNSSNQTLCSSSCSTDLLCNSGHCSGHLLQHQCRRWCLLWHTLLESSISTGTCKELYLQSHWGYVTWASL